LRSGKRDHSSERAKFDGANVAYYFGRIDGDGGPGLDHEFGGGNSFGGIAVFLLATCYAALFALAGADALVSGKIEDSGRATVYAGGVDDAFGDFMGWRGRRDFGHRIRPRIFRTITFYIKGSWILMEVGDDSGWFAGAEIREIPVF